MNKEAKDRLHRQLIRLGDMMGDGQHHEPDGEWIEKEYKQTMRALGIGPPRKNRTPQINKAVALFIKKNPCPECKTGKLKQTRSGAKRVICTNCGVKLQLKENKGKTS